MDQEMLAKANSGDRSAMVNAGIAYFQEGNYPKTAEYWEKAAELGSKNAVYNLLRNLYGRRSSAPNKAKCSEWLIKSADITSWGKLMLGAAHCGAIVEEWRASFFPEEYGSIFTLDGIERNFAKGIALINQGLAEPDPDIPLGEQDYEAIANAFENRFRYFKKNANERKNLYPNDEEPIEDLVQAIKFSGLSRDAIPTNHPIYDDLVKASNDIIKSLKGEVDAYKSAWEARDSALDMIKSFLPPEDNTDDKKRLHLASVRERNAKYKDCIFVSNARTVGLKKDGTVVATGNNRHGQCDTQDLQGIVGITGNYFNTVALKEDGTVLVVGQYSYRSSSVYSKLRDIIYVSCASDHFAGLKEDGTVTACILSSRDDEYGTCSTHDWRDIASVYTGNDYNNKGFTIGLKKDGSTLICGHVDWSVADIRDWQDISAIKQSKDYLRTVGIKTDGTVAVAGFSLVGSNFNNWHNIVDVCFDNWKNIVIGLKSDGTVVTEFRSDKPSDYEFNPSKWRKIVAISSDKGSLVGLKADGTVVATGNNDHGQLDVHGFSDIVAIKVGDGYTAGLKADGTVVAVGNNEEGQCNVQQWSNIGPAGSVSAEKREQRRQMDKQLENEQRRQWEAQGLCRYCGSQVGGLFTKKCKTCSKVQ